MTIINDCHGFCARLNKLTVALGTLQQLEKKIQDLRWWLLDVEHQLTRPIVYETCSNAEIQLQLRKQQVNNSLSSATSVLLQIHTEAWPYLSIIIITSSDNSVYKTVDNIMLFNWMKSHVTNHGCSLVWSYLDYANSVLLVSWTQHLSCIQNSLACMVLVISFPYKLRGSTQSDFL